MTELQVGVKVLLKNTEGKYLLLRRSARTHARLRNTWDIPGGRIEPGSDLMKNLAREVREETGLKMKGVPRIIAAQDIFPKGRHIVRITYVGRADGMPRLSDEHSEFAWKTVREMRALRDLDRHVLALLGARLIS